MTSNCDHKILDHTVKDKPNGLLLRHLYSNFSRRCSERISHAQKTSLKRQQGDYGRRFLSTKTSLLPPFRMDTLMVLRCDSKSRDIRSLENQNLHLLKNQSLLWKSLGRSQGSILWRTNIIWMRQGFSGS